jgi:hypothetical protein
MSPAESHLRQVLRQSMRINGDVLRRPDPEVPNEAGEPEMSNIDPQEFGFLQAQVKALLAADAEKTELLRELSTNVTAMRLQLAEARGGWRVLLLLGGGAATLGSGLTWAIQHFTRGP